jgi:hypothetical protein
LNKPVAITFSYEAYKDSVTVIPEVMGLAYQDSAGVWQFLGGCTVDSIKRTVTYYTTHFSDWSMMPWLSLVPHTATLEPGKEKLIQAVYYIPYEDCKCEFVPIPSGPGYPVGEPTPLESKYYDSWGLQGPGTLIPATANQAAYKAPAQVTGSVTVTVSLRLKSKHTLVLYSNITLISDNTFIFRINNGPYKSLPVGLVQLTPGKLSIATTGGESKEKWAMFFPQAKGTFAWGWDQNGNTISGLNYFPTGAVPYPCYTAQYTDADGLHDSGGGVTIDELGGVGEVVSGSFSLEPAGYDISPDKKSTATITGKFRIRRAL